VKLETEPPENRIGGVAVIGVSFCSTSITGVSVETGATTDGIASGTSTKGEAVAVSVTGVGSFCSASVAGEGSVGTTDIGNDGAVVVTGGDACTAEEDGRIGAATVTEVCCGGDLAMMKTVRGERTKMRNGKF